MHMHATGVVVELEVDPQEENQEAQHQEAPSEGKPKVGHLLGFLDHQPAMFVKGKFRSILSLPCFIKYYSSPLCLMH